MKNIYSPYIKPNSTTEDIRLEVDVINAEAKLKAVEDKIKDRKNNKDSTP